MSEFVNRNRLHVFRVAGAIECFWREALLRQLQLEFLERKLLIRYSFGCAVLLRETLFLYLNIFLKPPHSQPLPHFGLNPDDLVFNMDHPQKVLWLVVLDTHGIQGVHLQHRVMEGLLEICNLLVRWSRDVRIPIQFEVFKYICI